MLLRLERPLVFIDLEATGTNPRVDRVVEFAAVKVFPDGRREHLHLLLNPQRLISPEAIAVHGITNEAVAGKPTFDAVAHTILRFLAACDLAGFGIVGFDVPMLSEEFRRVGMDFSARGRRLVDAQRIYHLREPRTLSAALSFYCGLDHRQAHSAQADALAAETVLDAQLRKYADLPGDIAGLDSLCNPHDPEALDAEGKLRWRDKEVIIAFGQKAGMTLRELAAQEPGYLRWMLNKDFSPEVKQIVRDALDGKLPQP